MHRKTVSLLIVGILAIGLAACEEKDSVDKKGTEQASTEKKEVENTDNKTSAERQLEWAENQSNENDDVNENDDDVIELEEGMAKALKYYGNDDSVKTLESSEDPLGGFIKAEFEGFQVDFLSFLVDFTPNEFERYQFDDKEKVRAILMFTIAENTTDLEVDYNGTMQINTDTKEQVYPEYGIMSPNPVVMTYTGKVEKEGYFIIPLKDDSNPNEITIRMDAPYIVNDGAVDPENGMLGEQLTFELKGHEE